MVMILEDCGMRKTDLWKLFTVKVGQQEIGNSEMGSGLYSVETSIFFTAFV